MQIFTRTLIAIVLLLLVILANYLGPVVWSLGILLVSILAFLEFQKMCRNMGFYPVKKIIFCFISLFILCPLLLKSKFDISEVFTVQAISLLAAYAIIFSFIIFQSRYRKFEDLCVSLWAIFQLGLLPSFFTWMRMMDHGFEYIIITIFSIAANDSFSMLGGKIFGKHQLIKEISPGKTIEGSICGLVLGTLCFYWLTKIFQINFYNENLLFVIALIFAILGQIGDLLVSALKRAAGVKDSGSILLSHGGILDRIDSHIFAVWFAFFVFFWANS